MPGFNNDTAIELLVSHIHRQLDARTLSFRRDLAKKAHHDVDDFCAEKHINLLPQTSQLIVRSVFSLPVVELLHS